MSIISAVKRGTSAVQLAYNQQKQAAEDRAKRKRANAKTRLEKERAKLGLEREKVALRRELAEAKLALAQDKEALAKTRALAHSYRRTTKIGKGLSSGFKSFAKWYDQAIAPPKRRKATKRRIVVKRK